MKTLYTFAITVLVSSMLTGQNLDSQFASKVSSIDSIIHNLYDVISGDPGVARDWNLFRYLFAEEARLIPSGPNPNGKQNIRVITPDEYIEMSGPWLLENGFHEVEMFRTTDCFGPICQAFSSYESFHQKSDSTPFMRGINSIQLFNDGTRWWIVSIFWAQESPDTPIPDEYLPEAK